MHEHFSAEQLAILQERARRVAESSKNRAQDDTAAALRLRVHREDYAMPVNALTAVHEDLAIVPVPCVPLHVAGIANVRGHIVPVLDLAVLLDVPGGVSEGSTLVVVSADDITIALRVDAIGEIVNFNASRVAPVPVNLDASRTTYLQGVLPDGATLLDVQAILFDESLVVNETIA